MMLRLLNARHSNVRTLSTGPMARYQLAVQKGRLRPDDRQLETMKLLDNLHSELISTQHTTQSQAGQQSWSSLSAFSKAMTWTRRLTGASTEIISSSASTSATTPANSPRGLYIYGGVGSGKVRLYCTQFFRSDVPILATDNVHGHFLRCYARPAQVAKALYVD